MTPENIEKLFKAFPNLYSHEQIKRYGLCCGDGWYALLYQLSKKITEIDPQVRAIQVKNKFGFLRYYLDFGLHSSFNTKSPSYEKIDKLISEAEIASTEICEICGAKGQEEGMQVRCLEHKQH